MYIFLTEIDGGLILYKI